MTDIILSSFLSLFALFGKEEQVDESWAKSMLVSYLRHHFGIRGVDAYLDLYSDMRMAYEMTPELDTRAVVASICENLHGKIRSVEESMLLLRLMEFAKSGISNDGEPHVMFRAMAERGARIVFVPAQFNMQSGPHHWQNMLSARAFDYQYFVVGAAAARNRDFRYECYGHSLVIDPYGDLLAMAGEDEEIVYADVDLGRIDEVRGILPIIKGQRRDLYTISE